MQALPKSCRGWRCNKACHPQFDSGAFNFQSEGIISRRGHLPWDEEQLIFQGSTVEHQQFESHQGQRSPKEFSALAVQPWEGWALGFCSLPELHTHYPHMKEDWQCAIIHFIN